MSTVLGKSQVTPANVDGEPVDPGRSFHFGWVASLLNAKLTAYARAHQLGATSSGASYRRFAGDLDGAFRPDISFIERGRVTPSCMKGNVPIPPDLAIDVPSEYDTFVAVLRRVREYLCAGVRLVWLVNPQEREVQVFRADGTYSLVHSGDSLDGENVVPGFRCPLAEIFAPPPMGPAS